MIKAWEDLTVDELRSLLKIAINHLTDFGFVVGANGYREFYQRLTEWDEKRGTLKFRCPTGYLLWSHNKTKPGCECGQAIAKAEGR